MDRPKQILTHSNNLRNLLRFAQVNQLQLSTFLGEDLMEIVRLCETVDHIPAQAVVDIVELASIVCRRPALAVEIANWADIHPMSQVSVLLEACPTIAESLRVRSKYVHLETSALDMAFEESGGEVKVRHLINLPGQFGHSQYVEGSMMVAVRMTRMAAGQSWSPLRIEFEHPAPSDTRIHRAQFRCPIEFGAEQNAFYLSSEDMHRTLPAGNPRVLAYMEAQLQALGTSPSETLEAEVSSLIAQNLAAGEAKLTTIAKLMNMQPRSLQRRLSDEGLEFSELLNRVRRQVVESYVRAEWKPELMRLAYRLGYSEASNASRYLRQQFGTGLRGLSLQARTERARKFDGN